MSPTRKKPASTRASEAEIEPKNEDSVSTPDASEDGVLYPLTEEQVQFAREAYPHSKQPTVIALLLAEGINPSEVPSRNAFFEEGYIRIDQREGRPILTRWPSRNFGLAVLEVSAIEGR